MAVVQSNSSTGCILAIRNTLRLHLCGSEGRNLRFGQMASAKVISPPTDGSWAYCQNMWLSHSFRWSDLKSWDHKEKPRGTPEKKAGVSTLRSWGMEMPCHFFVVSRNMLFTVVCYAAVIITKTSLIGSLAAVEQYMENYFRKPFQVVY